MDASNEPGAANRAAWLAFGFRRLADSIVEQFLDDPYRSAAASLAAAALALAFEGNEPRLFELGTNAWPLESRRRFVVDLLIVHRSRRSPWKQVVADLVMIDPAFHVVADESFSTADAATLMGHSSALGLSGSPRVIKRRLANSTRFSEFSEAAINLRLFSLEAFRAMSPRFKSERAPRTLNEAIIIASSAVLYGLSMSDDRLDALRRMALPDLERQGLVAERFEVAAPGLDSTVTATSLSMELQAIDPERLVVPAKALTAQLNQLKAAKAGGRGNAGVFRRAAELVVQFDAAEFQRKPDETHEEASRRLTKALRKQRSHR